MPHVKLKNTPDQTTEVTEGEMTDLRRMGLILEEVEGEEQAEEQPAAPVQQAKAKVTRDKAFPASDDAEQSKTK